MLNPRAPQDALNVRTGKDGCISINTSEGQILLSEVNEFRFTASFQNADWQPTGSSLVYGVPTGHTLSLSVTETVIRDDLIMGPIVDLFEESGPRADAKTFTFQTELEGRNGKNQRILIRNCIPDGDVDLLNIVPGEIVQHPWNFRCNANPVILSQLELDY